MAKNRFSKAWIHAHLNDPYVKLAQQRKYRSRAAFKLIEIDDQDRLIRPGQTISAKVKVERHDFPGRVEFGKDGAGRNLPHGVFIDNLGLNGLLVVEGQDEREFFITAAPKAAPGRRLFHLRTTQNNGQASLPAVINVLPPRR